MKHHIPVTFQKPNSKDSPYILNCEIVPGQANEIIIKSILPDERPEKFRSENDRFGIPVLIDEDYKSAALLTHQKITAITILESWREPAKILKRTPYSTLAATWLERMSGTAVSIELAGGITLRGIIEPRLKEERQQIKKGELLEELLKEKKRKDDANNMLVEVLNKRVPLFAKIIQQLNKDEALFFMRLFAARFEMVSAQVYVKEDIPEMEVKRKEQEVKEDRGGRVALIRKKMKIGRWRLPYIAEIAREMGTSTANISQRRNRFFKKFSEVNNYYDITKNAFAAAFKNSRIVELLQDQLSTFKSQDNKKGGVMDSPKLDWSVIKKYEAEQREEHVLS